MNFRQQHSSFRLFLQFTDDDNNSTSESVLKVTFAFCWNGRRPLTRKKVSFFFSSAYCYRNHIAELKAPGGGTVCKRGWSGVAAELAELALVNQVGQLTHQVDDVTTNQLMTTPYYRYLGFLPITLTRARFSLNIRMILLAFDIIGKSGARS